MSKTPSAKGSAYTSPRCHATLSTPDATASRRASREHRLGGVEADGAAHAAREGAHDGARPARDVEGDVVGAGARGVDEEIERGLVVQGRGGRELRGLAGELIGDGGLVRGGGHWLRSLGRMRGEVRDGLAQGRRHAGDARSRASARGQAGGRRRAIPVTCR